MIDSQPEALIQVRMLPSSLGGRRGPTPENEYGCLMAIDGVNLDVRFRVDRAGPLRPGETTEVEVNFLNPDLARRHLKVGGTFRLREAAVIGDGEIKQIYFPVGVHDAAPVRHRAASRPRSTARHRGAANQP